MTDFERIQSLESQCAQLAAALRQADRRAMVYRIALSEIARVAVRALEHEHDD